MSNLMIWRARRHPRLHQENWGDALALGWRRWRLRWARHRERGTLRDLADNPHLLNDIGVTREEALAEAAKPFLAIADACTHFHAFRGPHV